MNLNCILSFLAMLSARQLMSARAIQFNGSQATPSGSEKPNSSLSNQLQNDVHTAAAYIAIQNAQQRVSEGNGGVHKGGVKAGSSLQSQQSGSVKKSRKMSVSETEEEDEEDEDEEEEEEVKSRMME